MAEQKEKPKEKKDYSHLAVVPAGLAILLFAALPNLMRSYTPQPIDSKEVITVEEFYKIKDRNAQPTSRPATQPTTRPSQRYQAGNQPKPYNSSTKPVQR